MSEISKVKLLDWSAACIDTIEAVMERCKKAVADDKETDEIDNPQYPMTEAMKKMIVKCDPIGHLEPEGMDDKEYLIHCAGKIHVYKLLQQHLASGIFDEDSE